MWKVDVRLRKYGQHGYVVLVVDEGNGVKKHRHLGERVALNAWDADKCAPKNNPEQALRIQEAKVLAMRNGVPARRNKYRKSGTNDLLEFYGLLIQERAKSKKVREQTLCTYRRSLRKIKCFLREMGQKTLTFRRFSDDFLTDFSRWMLRNGAGEAYIEKTISHICEAMQVAHERGLHENIGFRRKKERRSAATANNPIYLSQQEVEALARVELPLSMGRVRDAFLVRCYTGLRFSDTFKVNAASVQLHRGRQVIVLNAQKTGKETALPVAPELREIINRYPDGIPIHSSQYENKVIKKAAKKAGIERFSQVTTHTARRTFATNEYLLAIEENRSHLPIMRALGHSTEKMFFRYIRLSALENALTLRKGA